MTHLLVDLDDTLYSYAPAAHAAEAVAFARVASDTGVAEADVRAAFSHARKAVKARLGATGSAHSRLLYFAELAHALGRVDRLDRVRSWDRAYWSAFLETATLRAGALDLLRGVRARGGKVAIVSDLTLEIQLWKLEHFGLASHVDALVISEEVPADKPRPEAFMLAMTRLGGVRAEDCVMVGDADDKDGAGARALGIRYFKVDTGDGDGESLVTIARKLGEAR
ncbi:MAG: HAD family hydrolase [Polyangiaceae bacterium]